MIERVWIDFFMAVSLTVLMVFAPGFLLMRAFRFVRLLSLCAAPALSLALYGVLAIVFSRVAIPASTQTLFGAAVVVATATWIVGSALRGHRPVRESSLSAVLSNARWTTLFLYVGFAIIIGMLFFVRGLDGTEVFFQAWDNAWHLSLIKTFISTSDYSSLNATVYAAQAPVEVAPVFYPAAWHCLCAMVSSFLNVSIPLAENAINFVFASMVFPAGMYCLMECLLGEKRWAVVSGSVISVAFVAFPWQFLVFGPIFPNLASFAALPAVMVLFVAFWQRGLSASGRLLIVLALFVGIVGLALMQPNAVFTAAVFLAPYCVVLAYRAGGRLPGKTLSVHAKKILAGMLCGFAIVAIWLLLYKTPFLQSTVSFSWPSFASVRQAVVNAVLLAYVKQAQVALAVLVCCGIVYTLRNRKYLWMSVSFAIASLFYVVNASTDSLAKAVLTGFWYADPYRIAAMAAICAVPLAGLGFYAFIKFVIRFCDKLDLRWLAFGGRVPLAMSVGMVLFVVLNYYPSYAIPGHFGVDTAFGGFEDKVISDYNATGPNVLDSDEVAFLDEVEEIVPSNALILNQPHDGSAFAYGLNDLNLYYREFGDEWNGKETPESKVIRLGIDEVVSNAEVKEAVDKLDAQYILILDLGGEREDSYYLSSYDPWYWQGFGRLDDETPGFDVVLSRGDMRLYKIIA